MTAYAEVRRVEHYVAEVSSYTNRISTFSALTTVMSVICTQSN